MSLLTLFETQAMPKTTSRYRKQLFTEIDAVPEVYLPFLLQLIRTASAFQLFTTHTRFETNETHGTHETHATNHH